MEEWDNGYGETRHVFHTSYLEMWESIPEEVSKFIESNFSWI